MNSTIEFGVIRKARDSQLPGYSMLSQVQWELVVYRCFSKIAHLMQGVVKSPIHLKIVCISGQNGGKFGRHGVSLFVFYDNKCGFWYEIKCAKGVVTLSQCRGYKFYSGSG